MVKITRYESVSGGKSRGRGRRGGVEERVREGGREGEPEKVGRRREKEIERD